jgi:hypothetical protein
MSNIDNVGQKEGLAFAVANSYSLVVSTVENYNSSVFLNRSIPSLQRKIVSA